MSGVQDEFEESPYALEGTDDVIGIESQPLEEIETPSKSSVSKKAAKKRDARRRIEDYLELRRFKAVVDDFDNDNIALEYSTWFDEDIAKNSPAEE